MPEIEIASFTLYVSYYAFCALCCICFKTATSPPDELLRKTYHVLVALSVFPVLYLFDSWQSAAAAIVVLTAFVYPVMTLSKSNEFYKRMIVERAPGEARRQIIYAHLVLLALVTLFWGALGSDWKFVVLASMLAWGFGDSAAALVGRRFGRAHVKNRFVDEAKTLEGFLAMLAVSLLVITVCLLLGSTMSPARCLSVALVSSIVGAIAEIVTKGGKDTLSVPAATSAAVFVAVMVTGGL
jgi:dolichol kinase